ncbi:holliday junction resolvase [Streptomyces phage JPandJE]|nr:holliday junction resolvase [Streptomyces phage JPandJE]
MASQSRKHRGYRTQKVFAEYVRKVFPYAEPTGAGRQGRDILSTPGIWFELKARTGFNPLAALKQVEKEAKETAEDTWVELDIPGPLEPNIDLPIVVLRMNGQGEANIGEWVTCMRVDTLLKLLEEAGYGPQ